MSEHGTTMNHIITREPIPQDQSDAANAAHDRRYGWTPQLQGHLLNNSRKPEWQPASPILEREAIWSHHRALDEQHFQTQGH